MFSLDIIELNEGVPHYGRAGGLCREPVSLHAGHSQEVSLGAPLGLNICAKKGVQEMCVLWVTRATQFKGILEKKHGFFLPFSPERITAGERSS